MLRDNIKDETYFNKYISYQNDRIAKFEKILTQNTLEKSKKCQCHEYLMNYKLDLIKAKYSIGADIDEISYIFFSLINHANNTNELTYNTAIDVLSLAIIFGFTDISSIYNKISDKDDLINFLYEFALNKKIIKVKTCMYENIYKEFINIIKNKDEELLIKYMQDDWYKNNIDTAWYDTHNLSSEVYSGYWCFISIAIIKALNFDINKYNNVRFVPTDLY